VLSRMFMSSIRFAKSPVLLAGCLSRGERMKSLALLVVLALLVPANLSAQRKEHKPEQQTPEVERSASDAHSFMELFTKLERDWMGACQRKDRNALEDMLAPEFIVRSSSDPEHPVGRADWIQDALTNHQIRSYGFRAMTIRAFLGVAIVSFVQSEEATISGKKSNTDSLIVDIWEANHGKWQPAARFVAPVEKR
jgi:Domain of unknown function (DUF4440)